MPLKQDERCAAREHRSEGEPSNAGDIVPSQTWQCGCWGRVPGEAPNASPVSILVGPFVGALVVALFLFFFCLARS